MLQKYIARVPTFSAIQFAEPNSIEEIKRETGASSATYEVIDEGDGILTLNFGTRDPLVVLTGQYVIVGASLAPAVLTRDELVKRYEQITTGPTGPYGYPAAPR